MRSRGSRSVFSLAVVEFSVVGRVVDSACGAVRPSDGLLEYRDRGRTLWSRDRFCSGVKPNLTRKRQILTLANLVYLWLKSWYIHWTRSDVSSKYHWHCFLNYSPWVHAQSGFRTFYLHYQFAIVHSEVRFILNFWRDSYTERRARTCWCLEPANNRHFSKGTLQIAMQEASYTYSSPAPLGKIKGSGSLCLSLLMYISGKKFCRGISNLHASGCYRSVARNTRVVSCFCHEYVLQRDTGFCVRTKLAAGGRCQWPSCLLCSSRY
jgi:hypothetical protein